MNRNSRQTISRDEYRRLDNRVNCIILRRRYPRPVSLTLPAVTTEVTNPSQIKVPPHPRQYRFFSFDGRQVGSKHFLIASSPLSSTKVALSVTLPQAAPPDSTGSPTALAPALGQPVN